MEEQTRQGDGAPTPQKPTAPGDAAKAAAATPPAAPDAKPAPALRAVPPPGAAPAAPAARPPAAQAIAVDRTPAPPKPLPEPPPRAFSGAGPARIRGRHRGLLLSFVLCVLLPMASVGYYLWGVALPQYESRVGFSVQREQTSSAIELLGGITELSSGSSSDTDILYKFIQSRELVRALDNELDLVSMFTRPEDPVFTLGRGPTIEDIEAHWLRKVDVFYDTASQLIEVRALAFQPDDALAITKGIFAKSTDMLNNLTAIAREDATRYAREDLVTSQDRLKLARQALTAFRIRTQIVDPAADVQGRMGLLNSLLSQQVTALIDLDILGANTSPNDPRYLQAAKRVEVIEERIRKERARFGDQPQAEDERYADLVAEFEALSADMEFAQTAYLASVAAYDAAVAEAQRKSRYLATYVAPTLAERSQFPQRVLNMTLASGAFFAIWLIAVLVFYALRDRR